MTELKIINDLKLLRKKSVPVQFGTDLSYEISLMKELLLKYNIVGLSAIQVGLDKQIFLINSSFTTNNIKVIINPVIDYFSHNTEKLEESNISFPETFITKKRSKMIHAQFYDENWNLQKIYMHGFEARLFQQEYDYINGLF